MPLSCMLKKTRLLFIDGLEAARGCIDRVIPPNTRRRVVGADCTMVVSRFSSESVQATKLQSYQSTYYLQMVDTHECISTRMDILDRPAKRFNHVSFHWVENNASALNLQPFHLNKGSLPYVPSDKPSLPTASSHYPGHSRADERHALCCMGNTSQSGASVNGSHIQESGVIVECNATIICYTNKPMFAHAFTTWRPES